MKTRPRIQEHKFSRPIQETEMDIPVFSCTCKVCCTVFATPTKLSVTVADWPFIILTKMDFVSFTPTSQELTQWISCRKCLQFLGTFDTATATYKVCVRHIHVVSNNSESVAVQPQQLPSCTYVCRPCYLDFNHQTLISRQDDMVRAYYRAGQFRSAKNTYCGVPAWSATGLYFCSIYCVRCHSQIGRSYSSPFLGNLTYIHMDSLYYWTGLEMLDRYTMKEIPGDRV